MRGERSESMMRIGTVFAAVLSVALSGCGSTSNNLFSSSSLDIFRSSSKATSGDAGTGSDGGISPTDIECPNVEVRTGAATLMIGSKPNDAEPSAVDLRYQGTIIRTARECQVNAGVMTMKIGVEGRVITGPAGGPGAVDVPLRIAVVHEGVNPKTIISKFSRESVTVSNAVDRVTFTHIDPDVTFPLPVPLADIDSYVVYIGFDPLGAPPEKKKTTAKSKPTAKKKPATKPSQS